jgi:hypothetical protein
MKSFLWLTKHPPTTGTVSKKLRRAFEVDPGFLALFYVVAICRKSFHGIYDPGKILSRHGGEVNMGGRQRQARAAGLLARLPDLYRLAR